MADTEAEAETETETENIHVIGEISEQGLLGIIVTDHAFDKVVARKVSSNPVTRPFSSVNSPSAT